MKITTPLFILLFFTGISCSNDNHELLVEAESFLDKGSWLVDPQFTEQMGSPYLLAHGLGTPVRDASTTVTIPARGKYHVWVRTLNWAKGDWEAPGRFKIVINGIELKSILGTGVESWHWQYAGRVPIEDPALKIVLKDLTGFDGRCDAVYFSTKKTAPPSDGSGLASWRKKLGGDEDIPERQAEFDLVITGGGIAGCAAAIAAAEQGLLVALVHDRPVLGGNASSEIRVHTEGIAWKSERIINMLNTVWWPNGSPEAMKDDRKRHDNMAKYKNISIFLNWRVYSANTEDGKITSIDARQTATGRRMRFSAPLFADCTGDGWIGYWAGAEFMYGREDSSKYGESLAGYGELWSPSRADGKVMGSSVLWTTYDAGKAVTFPDVPWAMDVAGDHTALSGTWQWEFSRDDLNQIDDAEYIRDHILKAIYGSFSNAKKDPANANIGLDWVGYLVGKRESRRLTGDYIYTFNDERNMTEFHDAVAMETRNIDVHYQQAEADSAMPDFMSEALYHKVDHYYIPYRTLYSKNIENLFMAGRCFSCSHVGLGGPRVMHTTGQMGVAVGYAASLCRKYNTVPRGIYENHIAELRKLIGIE
jgi:hypothetical protein